MKEQVQIFFMFNIYSIIIVLPLSILDKSLQYYTNDAFYIKTSNNKNVIDNLHIIFAL